MLPLEPITFVSHTLKLQLLSEFWLLLYPLLNSWSKYRKVIQTDKRSVLFEAVQDPEGFEVEIPLVFGSVLRGLVGEFIIEGVEQNRE